MPNKTRKITLTIFAIVYNLLTILMIAYMMKDQSSSLGFIFIFPIFWIFLGIILFIIQKDMKNKDLTEKILIYFATPIPLFIFLFFYNNFTDNKYIQSSYEYNKNGKRHKEIEYQYINNGQTQRKEFYISVDSITPDNPMNIQDTWLKDSIWIYYNESGKLKKTEDYRKKDSR